MIYILFNPLAGNNKGIERVEPLKELYKESEVINITTIKSLSDFIDSKNEDDEIIIAGGDGTLNRFINAVYGKNIKQHIYFYPMGSGNDFVKDVGLDEGKKITSVNKYITDLPDVYVNDEEKPRCKFFNGLGYGIDGYCCQEGDKQREKDPNKEINYTSIAIKGILGGYKPTDAKVTVDGKEYNFKKVFIAPIMHGRYYGGGFFPAPEQNRLDPTTLSVYVMHDISRLTALLRINSIKAGTHLKYKKMSFLATGCDITVEFKNPTALQIDGETVLNVTKIRAVAAKRKDETAKEEGAKSTENKEQASIPEEKIEKQVDFVAKAEPVYNGEEVENKKEVIEEEKDKSNTSEKIDLEKQDIIKPEQTIGENLATKSVVVDSKTE